MIRWKKRLNGWAMFRNTSRKASAWVKRTSSGRCIAEVSKFKCWLRPPSLKAAQEWCERTYSVGWDHLVSLESAIIVMPDGKVEQRPLERPGADLRIHIFPGLNLLSENPQASVPVEEICLRGRVFALVGADPNTGQYIKWEVYAYSLPKHEHIADELARVQLEDASRKHYYRSQSKPPRFGIGLFGQDIWRTT